MNWFQRMIIRLVVKFTFWTYQIDSKVKINIGKEDVDQAVNIAVMAYEMQKEEKKSKKK